ncbi:MAG: tetratricopeptide repeat protein [Kofleriaceae bacterium]
MARGGDALAVTSVALVFACSAPATLPELAAAEQSETAGQTDRALDQYRAAQQKCGGLKPERRAKLACSQALLGEAELLEHVDRTDQAIAAYIAIPPRVEAEPDGDPPTAATALYRAGVLLLHAERPTQAYTALWRVVTDFPDEAAAGDAVKTLLDDGRTRAPEALATELEKLATTEAATQVGDNIIWSLADLYAHELNRPEQARALYDRIPNDFPTSGLRDDARWFAAKLSEQLGDPRGAVERLRALTATREVALMAGSYFSVWLDDAQLELGKLLRDDLHDLDGAAAAFRQLPKDYPASILRDDALFELAVTLEEKHDTAGRCRAVADLVKLDAESKYIARAKELGPCP